MSDLYARMYERRDARRVDSCEYSANPRTKAKRSKHMPSGNGKRCDACSAVVRPGEPMERFAELMVCAGCYEKRCRVCVVCGSTFTSTINNKKTCSAICSRAFALRKSLLRYRGDDSEWADKRFKGDATFQYEDTK